MYKVEKSKVGIEFDFLRLFSLLIASITGLLFCNTQKVLTPVKNLHLLLYACIFLESKRKIDVIVRAIYVIVGFRRRYYESNPSRVFMYLRHPVH